MNTISFDLIKKLRKHINRSEKLGELLENHKKWFRLTTSLDVLEDASCAVQYYFENDYPDNINGKYLFTYGLLQALFVQEDALNSISIALFGEKIEFKKDYPAAYEVREMRNDVVGHPTCRDDHFFFHLNQISMEKESFQYIVFDSDKYSNEHKAVDLYSAISDVATCVNTVLTNSINKLDEEFRKYIDMHKNRKMKDIFKSLSYAKEKALTGSDEESGYTIAKKMMEECKAEVLLRYKSLDVVGGFQSSIEETEEIIDIIDNEITGIPICLRNRIKKQMMKALFLELKHLEECCKDTDDYFENYGEQITSETIECPDIIFEGADELQD